MATNFVSIITVNYNGKKYLSDFLTSALDLDYPRNKYEVVVVDNASADGSREFIEKNFPDVVLISANKNLGFAAGNNLGMKMARGNLFFLVNNDTIMEKPSLKNILDTYKRWSKKAKVGAVASKLVLVDSYIPIEIEEAFFSGHSLSPIARPINQAPFVIPHDTSSLFTERVFLPLRHTTSGSLNLSLKIKPFRRNEFKIFFRNKLVYKDKFKNLGSPRQIKLTLTEKQLKKYKIDLVQNAGNFYFRDGFGRDRGAIVLRHKQFYEGDYGQYDKEEAIPGFCGAGVLLYKRALEKVGYFDEDFFMYYEDGELSFRLKEYGYKTVFSPKAVIRHIHAGSSVEWSHFFIFHVERGRLLFIAKHWPRAQALRQLLLYIVFSSLMVPIYYFIKKDRKIALSKLIIRLKVIISILPKFILGLIRTKRIDNNQLKRFL